MIPYDSFLIDPFLLMAIGFIASRILANRPPWERGRALKVVWVVTMIVFMATSISLYFNLEWTRWLWELCRAQNGRDWMLNSGVFHFEYLDPPWTTHVISALIFCTYPGWLWLGLQMGSRKLTDGIDLGPSHWQGRRGRTEVWYATMTDPDTGDGFWVHYEITAPLEGQPFAHGWAAWFPAGGRPTWSRFGPYPVTPAKDTSRWFDVAGNSVKANLLTGAAETIRWNLSYLEKAPPLFPFPRWLWDLEILPGCMTVLAPTATFSGTVTVEGRELRLERARGGLSRIYGHGNAQRWAWLHADLGDGDVLEVVAAVSRHGLLRSLPPLPFVRLRLNGEDWPASPLLGALSAFHAEIDLPRWTVTGTIGQRRIRIEVDVPPDASVSIPYSDPDGSPALCTNSERASAKIVLERRAGSWQVEKTWQIDGTAHAEVGTRPA